MTSFRGLTALAVVIICAMAATAWAVQTPVFDYQFPASYDGTTTACDDQSAANHDATVDSLTGYAAGVVPPGFGAESGSLDGATTGRGVTNDNLLLANNLVSQYGGFEYDTWIKPVTYGAVQPYYLDYAGTETLMLNRTGASSDYVYRFQFRARAGYWNVYSQPIDPSKWYRVRVSFAAVLPTFSTGESSGVAVMTVYDPVADTTDTQWMGMVKTVYGDSLNRKIGLNRHSNSTTSSNAQGCLFNPEVSLGPNPDIDAISLITPPGGVGNQVACWKLDEAVGPTIADSGPNGLNGTVVNGVTLGRPGARPFTGTSAGFNRDLASDDAVDVARNDLLNSDSFTVALWINPMSEKLASTTAWQIPIDNRGSGTTGWSITIGPGSAEWNNEIVAQIGAGPASWTRLLAGPLAGDVWTHVAMTYDAATDIGRLYVNGQMTSLVKTDYVKNTVNPLRMGRLNTGAGSYPYCGDLDDVRLYDFALTDEQIGAMIPEPGLIVLLLGALAGFVAFRTRR